MKIEANDRALAVSAGSGSSRLPREVLTIAEMREAEHRLIAGGTPGFDLMRRAGEAVADRAHAMVEAGPVGVLCGPGNNGGDGFIVAEALRRRGREVVLESLMPPDRFTGDAARAARAWGGPVGEPGSLDLQTTALVVDALFGIGLTRPLTGTALGIVQRLNGAGRPVLAVDVPSGLDADTGAILGAVVHATETVTFARLKPGHILFPGRGACGAVTVVHIGIPDTIIAALVPRAALNVPPLWAGRLPRPAPDGHKYGRGHALVASGDATRTGAARLAARAALRVGAGLVTLASPADALPVNAAHLTAIMLRPCDGPEGLSRLLEDRRFNALVLGPGLGVGEATKGMVRLAAEAGRSLVLDADALTSFAGDADRLAELCRQVPESRVVLTPHEGEFARLLGPDTARMSSKLVKARRAAERLSAIVVLKGADTVIAAPDGRVAVNANGTPYLATAGSGDVLAGFVAGLMAQGMPAFEAGCAAVWLHAEAGSAIGPGLIAEDLPERLPAVLSRVLKER